MFSDLDSDTNHLVLKAFECADKKWKLTFDSQIAIVT